MTKYEHPNIEGWMSPKELQALHDLAGKAELVIEIGSWKGRSTHALCSGCKGKVIAVDHFKGNPTELETEHKEAVTGDIHGQFIENTKGFKNLSLLQMPSKEAAKLINPWAADIVFIDGDHEHDAVLTDIISWWPAVKPNGILCGHDVNMPSVKRALSEWGHPYDILADNIWIIKKGVAFETSN